MLVEGILRLVNLPIVGGILLAFVVQLDFWGSVFALHVEVGGLVLANAKNKVQFRVRVFWVAQVHVADSAWVANLSFALQEVCQK